MRFVSYGIIVYYVRDGKVWLLVVKNRYTPYFMDLIQGRFRYDDADNIIKLVKGGITKSEFDILYSYTPEELITIAKNQMRIRKTKGLKGKYKKIKRILKMLIIRENITSKLINESIYEFPKGRISNTTNTDLRCAFKEFNEETEHKLIRSDINKIHKQNIIEKYHANNHEFIINYLIIKSNKMFYVYNTPKNTEIFLTRWIPIEDLLSYYKNINYNKKCTEAKYNTIKSLFKIINDFI